MTRLGVDETSSKKGHKYVIWGVDLDASGVIYVCEEKGKAEKPSATPGKKDVPEEQVTELGMDLSPAFIAGAATYFRPISCSQITQRGYG